MPQSTKIGLDLYLIHILEIILGYPVAYIYVLYTYSAILMHNMCLSEHGYAAMLAALSIWGS